MSKSDVLWVGFVALRWGGPVPGAFGSPGVCLAFLMQPSGVVQLYVCIYVCMYVCMYVCPSDAAFGIRAAVYVYMYVCMYVCMSFLCSLRIRAAVCMYVCMYVCMSFLCSLPESCSCVYVCMYVCMYVFSRDLLQRLSVSYP